MNLSFPDEMFAVRQEGEAIMITKGNGKLIALMCCIFFAGGCASITGTENQSVSVQTREQAGREVAGAACELSNEKGKWFVTTPGSIVIRRSNDDMQIVCSKVGLEPGRASVTSATKGSMFGNIVFGGGIGAIIDHNKGTAYEYPNFVQIVMGAFTKIDAPDLNANPTVGAASSAPGPAATPIPAITSALPDKPSVSLEDSLKELRRLRDAGLISNEIYLERQRLLLDAKR